MTPQKAQHTPQGRAMNLVTYPWDTVSIWCPAWDEIAGKAQHYKTARRRSDGKYLQLLGVTRYADGLELTEPLFMVRDEIGLCRMSTDQLCGFVL